MISEALRYFTIANAEDLYVSSVRSVYVKESHVINESTTHSARTEQL